MIPKFYKQGSGCDALRAAFSYAPHYYTWQVRAFTELEDWTLGGAELNLCFWKTASNNVMKNWINSFSSERDWKLNHLERQSLSHILNGTYTYIAQQHNEWVYEQNAMIFNFFDYSSRQVTKKSRLLYVKIAHFIALKNTSSKINKLEGINSHHLTFIP
jgi:hypothetical protein